MLTDILHGPQSFISPGFSNVYDDYKHDRYNEIQNDLQEEIDLTGPL